ncbi:DUF349 domain-containing protein [Actinomyces sp. 2119]|uniref:DUF349 domain-containing protein n=1 Tax=Actinomyces sp. 2119 TaxID=2321393 RepID=UPI000E6BB43D|nr:DUF349 domain-containing protein [Actinomyces sp. 2119]RJF44714.1 DUF349 domain-containing protein [Actinomyces sp. 2119]
MSEQTQPITGLQPDTAPSEAPQEPTSEAAQVADSTESTEHTESTETVGTRTGTDSLAAPDTTAQAAQDGSDQDSDEASQTQEASAPGASETPEPSSSLSPRSPEPAEASPAPPAQPEGPDGAKGEESKGEESLTPPAAQATQAQSAPAAPSEPTVDPQEAMDAAKWGRVDGEGRVYVQDGGTEREVGQFPDVPVAEAMAFYVRRFLDLKSTVDLFATRLPQLSVREIDSTLKSVEDSLKEPAAVGDLDGLRSRFAALKTVATERREAVAAERAAAKEQALKERTAIVERAEAIAAQDPARTQWKSSGTELRELLESWKQAQRRGPRLDRPTEDGLWKRFSHARTTFDRHRRQFFSELDARQAKVRAAKEALIKKAEELQNSTDWAGTSAKYRDLLEEWKKAGRASRKEDDALWARFRAAQQVFFDARRAKDAAADAELAENLKVKEALLAKAEALVPVTDVKAARRALRPIQDAWDEAGKVPRGAVRRVEGRMRAVEDAVREAENAEWRRSDPETKARAEGLAGQLQDAIAALETDLAAARTAGDSKKVAEAEAALTARRAWLEQVRRSARA